MNFDIGSTFSEGSGSAFSEGSGPGPGPLYNVCPAKVHPEKKIRVRISSQDWKLMNHSLL